MRKILYHTIRVGSIQQTLCPILEVGQKMFRLQVAGAQEWLAVLEVQGLDDRLRSEEEQDRLNEHFQQILISLPHPFQILLRIAPIDLKRSLALTPSQQAGVLADHERAQQSWSETGISTSHVQFRQNSTPHQTLLERRVYLVIPALAESVQEETETTFARVLRPQSHSEQARAAKEARAREQLTIRCQDLARRLSALPLITRRLSNDHLMELSLPCLRLWEARNHPLHAAWRVNPLARQTDDQHQWPLHSPRAWPGPPPIRWPIGTHPIAPRGLHVWSDHVKIDQDCEQVLDLYTLPRQVTPGWLSQLMRIDEVMDISLFSLPQPVSPTMQRIERRSRTAPKQENDRHPGRVAAEADMERLMEHIVVGYDRVLQFAMHVLIRGKEQREIHRRTERARAVLSRIQLGSRSFEQEKGRPSCLCSTCSQWWTNVHPRPKLDKVSSIFPYLSQMLDDPHGILQALTYIGDAL